MKVILHLCADLGSDSYPYQCDPEYKVFCIGKDIGVENINEQWLKDNGIDKVHGIIANPPCYELSRARIGGPSDPDHGLILVRECERVIEMCKPEWWVMENPFSSEIRREMGTPLYWYQPWWYGSPWNKKTGLWGDFNIPPRIYTDFEDVPERYELYQRKGSPHHPTNIPSFTDAWDTQWAKIPEFRPFLKKCHSRADFRSLCSQKFAEAFKKANP